MTVTYPKHRVALSWAQAQIGKHEEPMGSNTGPFVILCQRATWLLGTKWPWCRAFNLRARKQAGDIPGDGSAGAWDALERAKRRGEALRPAEYRRAIPADEVIWGFGSGHASLLVGFTRRGGEVHVLTVDGNVGDRVKECERPLSQVKGFIHWPEVAVRIADKPPLFEVVGSESGHAKVVYVSGQKAISRKLGQLLNRYGGLTIRPHKRRP